MAKFEKILYLRVGNRFGQCFTRVSFQTRPTFTSTVPSPPDRGGGDCSVYLLIRFQNCNENEHVLKYWIVFPSISSRVYIEHLTRWCLLGSCFSPSQGRFDTTVSLWSYMRPDGFEKTRWCLFPFWGHLGWAPMCCRVLHCFFFSKRHGGVFLFLGRGPI